MGVIYVFGAGSNGQLGYGRGKTVHTPQSLNGLPEIKEIACLDFNTYLLSSDSNEDGGTVYTCGDGNYAGHGDSVDLFKPTPLKNLPPIKEIACGDSGYVLLLSRIEYSGIVYKFGNGNEPDKNIVLIPTKIFEGAIKIACGHFHSAFINTKDIVYTANTDIYAPSSKFTPILGLPNIISVACGGSHTVLLSSNGRVYTFGYYLHGVLGHNDGISHTIPKEVKSLKNVVEISCGKNYTMVVACETQSAASRISPASKF
jgi:alpha-tubulin suppressor-like RCC1 family protein